MFLMGFPETFRALADPVRREILVLLKRGRVPAGEIAAQFDLTAASVSYHLSQLKRAGLVAESREKNYIYYELNATVLEEALLWISQFTTPRSQEGNTDEENKHEKSS